MFAAAFAALLALSACVIKPPELPLTEGEAEETTPLVAVPVSAAWVNAAGMTSVLERGLVNSSEQRIGLVNRTAVPGDNLMILRSRDRFGQIGRLRFDEFMKRIGEVPAPFADVKSGDLRTGSDALGTYFWAEQRMGANTLCILGLRRLGAGGRQLPGDADALDVLVRNCVNGTTEEALAPLMADSVGSVPMAASGPGQSRMLSALAGPSAQ
jgi:hypothetical protein